MALWLSANLGNIIIITVLVLIVFFIVRKLIRDKKQGRSCCGGSCAQCKMCASGKCEGGS